MFTPDGVYLRWVNIDTKVLGTLLFIVCLTRRNERHLVIFKKSSPGNVKKESDYIGAKFYYQMPFISSSELFFKDTFSVSRHFGETNQANMKVKEGENLYKNVKLQPLIQHPNLCAINL